MPDDILVVCFDDYPFSDLASPRVTCYGVNVDGMAQAGVDQLCRRWQDPEAEVIPLKKTCPHRKCGQVFLS